MDTRIKDSGNGIPNQVLPVQRATLTPEMAAAELRESGLVGSTLTECASLEGGTTSRVAALSRPGAAPELVVKLNAPAVIRAEALFLLTHRASPLVPSLHHLDPAGRFLVCEFVPGVHVRYGEDRVNVADVLLTLVRDLLAHLAPHGQEHGGGTATRIGTVADLLEESDARAEGAPTPGTTGGTSEDVPLTWPQFLGGHVAYRHARLSAYLPAEDLRLVERLARAPRRTEAAPLFMLHGDCGAHNFLFRPHAPPPHGLGPLVSVIDPYPLVGYPIFDLAFAFVSWPNGLEPDAVQPAAEALRASGRWRPNGDPREILCEEVLIALYNRMGTCLAHHPRDLPAYLAVWPRWRGLAEDAATKRGAAPPASHGAP